MSRATASRSRIQFMATLSRSSNARIHTPSTEIIGNSCSNGYEVKELAADSRHDLKDVYRKLMGTRGVPSMMQVRAISFTKVCNLN